jgi:hypothetical protein
VRTIGVPASLRPLLWQTFSGAKAMMEHSPSDYSRLTASLTKEMRSSAVMAATADQVDKDLQRTFPTHDFFESKEGMETLRRVLLAYSLRNPAVGYCQSMNFIVAILILFMEEEAAYWVLVPSPSHAYPRTQPVTRPARVRNMCANGCSRNTLVVCLDCSWYLFRMHCL